MYVYIRIYEYAPFSFFGFPRETLHKFIRIATIAIAITTICIELAFFFFFCFFHCFCCCFSAHISLISIAASIVSGLFFSSNPVVCAPNLLISTSSVTLITYSIIRMPDPRRKHSNSLLVNLCMSRLYFTSGQLLRSVLIHQFSFLTFCFLFFFSNLNYHSPFILPSSYLSWTWKRQEIARKSTMERKKVKSAQVSFFRFHSCLHASNIDLLLNPMNKFKGKGCK